MALVTVYDKVGTALIVEGSDAREYIASGGYFATLNDVPTKATPTIEVTEPEEVPIPSPSPDVIVSRRKAGK